jgi:hypothetical protein
VRLPLVSPIESRDGTGDQDGACFNLLVEQDEQGVFMGIRPALSRTSGNSGNGKGIVEFNGALVSVFGTTLGRGDAPSSLGTITGDFFDFVQSTQ